MKKILLLLALTLSFPLISLAHGGVDDDTLIIRMTNKGFEPKELTLVDGDEVLFINNDDVNRWPASNFHPTHGIYPEFDPLKGIKPGDSWTMRFEKVGNWRMHDHLIPHMTGVIVVLEDPEKEEASGPEVSKPVESAGFWERIRAFFTKLFRKNSQSAGAIDTAKLREFKTLDEKGKYAWLENIATTEDPRVAWQYVIKAYSGPNGTDPKAHDMAHLVGQLIFKSYGMDGLPTCSPIFAFGCYHGLMAVAFEGKDAQAYKESLEEADKGCQKLGNLENPAYWSCVHGIGHGVITYREHAAPEALDDCDLLNERGRGYCYDGIFMELSISGTPDTYRKNDPLYPCNAIDKKYQIACSRAQSRIMRSMFGMNTAAIARLCSTATETIRYHCIDSLGYYAAQTSPASPQQIVMECESITNENDQAQCKAAAAGELVFQDAIGWKANTKAICESLDAHYLSICLDRIEKIKTSYGRE